MIQSELKLPAPPSTTVMQEISASTTNASKKDLPDIEDSSTSSCASDYSTQNELTVAYGSPNFRDVPTGSRKGHLFLGCLCDMRRAVVAVNVLSILGVIIQVSFAIWYLAVSEEDLNEDDDLSEWLASEETLPKEIVAAGLALCMLSLLIYSLGIRGALKFNVTMVSASTIYHCVTVVLHLLAQTWLLAAFEVLCVYPHIMFIQQVGKGIMTAENYVNEKRICCV